MMSCGRCVLLSTGTRRLEVTLQHHKTLLSGDVGLDLRISGWFFQIIEVYCVLHNNQINARALIGQSLWVIVPVNPRKNRASSELLYKSNRPQISMGYRLINHLGCWWFTNSSRVLPTSRVVYQLITHRNLWSVT